MILRSPCPKCREPLLPGVTKCGHCSYRLMRWEARRARQLAGIRILLSALFIGTLVYVFSQN